MPRRKLHEKECWSEFCAEHKTGGNLPTWVNNLGSWVHSVSPQLWDSQGKDLIKKVLTAVGPVVLTNLNVPPGIATVVVDYVKGQSGKTTAALKAVKELEGVSKKQALRKELLKRKDNSKPPPAITRGPKKISN